MQIQPEYLLADFRAYMEEQLGSKNTADRYYYAVCRFFRENAIEDFSQVEPSLVLEALEASPEDTAVVKEQAPPDDASPSSGEECIAESSDRDEVFDYPDFS